MKCEICLEKEVDEDIVLINKAIIDKTTGKLKEWKLCEGCFNLWSNHKYEELTVKLDRRFEK